MLLHLLGRAVTPSILGQIPLRSGSIDQSRGGTPTLPPSPFQGGNSKRMTVPVGWHLGSLGVHRQLYDAV
eukprot:SAG11_NODE_20650_length_441_cov_0.739766_2_plen_69_part_01